MKRIDSNPRGPVRSGPDLEIARSAAVADIFVRALQPCCVRGWPVRGVTSFEITSPDSPLRVGMQEQGGLYPHSAAQLGAAVKSTQAAAARSRPQAKTREPRAVNVATTASGQSAYVAALIEEKGISPKRGLKIENLAMGFTETANALKLGRADASTTQPSTAAKPMKDQNEVRLIAPRLWSGNAWVVRKDAPYETLKHLQGKQFGNCSRVTGAYFFSAVIAKEHGLDVEKDFESVRAETGALTGLLERGDAAGSSSLELLDEQDEIH